LFLAGRAEFRRIFTLASSLSGEHTLSGKTEKSANATYTSDAKDASAICVQSLGDRTYNLASGGYLVPSVKNNQNNNSGTNSGLNNGSNNGPGNGTNNGPSNGNNGNKGGGARGRR